MTEKNNKVAYIYAMIAVVFWASSFPAVRYVGRFYSAGPMMLLRFLVASLTMAVIAYFKKIKKVEKTDIKYFILAGGVGIFLYMWMFSTAGPMVQSGISSFIIASAPLFSAILAIFWLKEKLKLRNIIGILISGCGLVLVAVSQVKGLEFNLGIVLLVLCAIATSIYSAFQRFLSKSYDSITITTYCIFIATAMMLFFLPALYKEIQVAPPLATWLIVFMGVFPAAIAYLCWSTAIAKTENIAYVTNCHYLTPFIATALGFFLLNEVLPPIALIGGIIIVGGMFLANKK